MKIMTRLLSLAGAALLACSAFTGLTVSAAAESLGDSATWEVTGTVLKIGGTGATPDYEITSRTPWSSSQRDITKVEIGSGITRIGSYLFSHLRSLQEVTIPDTVTVIGLGAFNYCKTLPALTLPNSVKTIEKAAFFQCEALTDITIPASVETVSESAFYGCTELKNVTILNPQCSLPSYSDTFSGKGGSAYTGTLTGYAGSTTQAFAEKDNIPFLLVGETPPAEELLRGDYDGDAQYILRYYTANTISGSSTTWDELLAP